LLFTAELEWYPHSSTFEDNKQAVSDHVSLLMPLKERSINNIMSNTGHPEVTDQFTSVSLALNDHALLITLQDSNALTVKHVLASTGSTKRNFKISAEELSKLWGIGLLAASQTLKATTQRGIQNAVHLIVYRYATKQCQLKYNQLGSQHGRFYTDTFFSSCKSSIGHTMAQLFVNDI
jgi:hypothetical protein